MKAEMESYVTTFRSNAVKTKETCKQCRFRKVRCDGRADVCGNCERLSFACSFSQAATPEQASDDPQSPSSAALARPERRRASKACDGCRDQKVRCSGDTPQCLACKRRRVECNYPSATRKGVRAKAARTTSQVEGSDKSRSPVASSPAQLATPISPQPSTGETEPQHSRRPSVVERIAIIPESDPDIPPPDSTELVDYFFDVVYQLPSYAFLYRPKTRQKWIDGSLDGALRLAISGVALSYQEASLNPAATEHPLASRWIQKAEHIVWERLETPTVSRLQALMLVILYRINIGQFQRAFMLLSLAARAAAAMRLNHERSDQHSTTLEVRRRLMWCMKLVERYFCIGLPEFELCPQENIYLRMPSCEADFAEMRTGMDKYGPGAYPLCIKLERIRRDIMRLTRSLALCEQPFPQLPQMVLDFEKDLVAIGEQMEGGPSLTPRKLDMALACPWLPRVMLMHLSWHQCHCDLYRLFLSGFREAAPKVVLDALSPTYITTAASLCFQHATAIIQILSNLNQQSTQPRLLEFDTAICAYHAVRLVLFLSRASVRGSPLISIPNTTEEFALSRAELCLASLKRFFPSSTLAKPIIEEMTRAISAFPSDHNLLEPETAQPEPPTNPDRTSPQVQLSAAAKARQRLAIHSLLRQADFSDGDEDDPSGPYPYPYPASRFRTAVPPAMVEREVDHPGLGSAPVVNTPQPDFPRTGSEREEVVVLPPIMLLAGQTPPGSVFSEAGSGSSRFTPNSPCVTLEWQDREWLSRGFRT
ncbi:hypothetical protein GE09DRAFT_1091872 [Coniochaeta sp. 2T2.1]|nr:hypothetical protein GE09DRAFT_1091872 [Coniochaeta sp. 2T2.1]